MRVIVLMPKLMINVLLNAKIRATMRADNPQKYYFISIKSSICWCSTMLLNF